jgi:putative SOS response-associated peptidase YedK
MCNLYRMTKNASEVAAWFGVANEAVNANFASEIFPGYPGLVVADGALRAMVWGFPLALTGAKGQPLKPRPVNNARDDKLGGSFWRDSFALRRCLIPLTGWAEAEGPKGQKTRTWVSLRADTATVAPLFAAAGLWRHSDQWGACFSMVMTGSAGSAVAPFHSRMPVLVAPSDWPVWLAGAPDAAHGLCRAWPGPLVVDRTVESWASRAAGAPTLF